MCWKLINLFISLVYYYLTMIKVCIQYSNMERKNQHISSSYIHRIRQISRSLHWFMITLIYLVYLPKSQYRRSDRLNFIEHGLNGADSRGYLKRTQQRSWKLPQEMSTKPAFYKCCKQFFIVNHWIRKD